MSRFSIFPNTKEICHEYTDEIVCPHCGYEFDCSVECGVYPGVREVSR